LREEHRVRVFENRVLRRIFGPKREEDGSWRKLHNDGVHGGVRGVYRFLVGRPESKRPLGRPRHRWEDNIKLDIKETGIDGQNWFQLAQDTFQWRSFVNTVMNLRVP
jgi:hypothetical protein